MGREKKSNSINNKGDVTEESSQNIFSKFYNYLEKKYVKASDWLSEKGIPLNKLNNYLEEKGLPAFAIVASFLLLILFIIFFLIFFSFSNQSELTFNIKDFQENSLTNIYLTISDSKKDVFSGIVENNSTKKIKLKVGETYSFKATKDTYPDILEQIKIIEKKQIVSLTFLENIEYGILKIKLKDRENKKTISSGIAKVTYTINNTQETKEATVDIFNDHFITLELPMYKDLELLVSADNYEDYKETKYRLNSSLQEKVIEMDIASFSFQGKSKVTFIVLDKENNFIEDAEVLVFNLSGQEIANQKTIDGKAITYIDSGETISYTIKKEGFKTFVSDENISLRIINLEETFTTVLELGGNFIDIFVRTSTNYLGLDDVLINLYNENNVVIDSGKTNFSGEINFNGINIESDLLITACKENYFCENKIVNLENETKAEFVLEKIDAANSSILNIFVVDERNMPVSNSSIKIYELLEGTETKEIPYNTNLNTDLTGSLSLPLKVDKKYRVYAFVGDSMVFEDITINQLKENKIIFVIDNASRLLKLDLYDENGNKISSGHLLIKAKDGTVLYDQNISFGEDIIFNSQGYKDFIAEYTDENGNKSYVNFTGDQADNAGYIKLDFSKEVNTTDYPIIEFVGVSDERGIMTNFMSVGKDYYLIFDVLFPEKVYNGEVHIRAGDDMQVDSEEMSYGINGFLSMDITNFRYGTTYNSSPEPGMQGTDFLNEGSSQILNKWLELKWRSDVALSNKQIKVKVKALDLTNNKLIFKYRALYHENDLYFRDPIDPVLNQSYTSNKRSALYADTKEIVIDLFDIPLDCKDDFCISYNFLDNKNNIFTRDDFFAIKDQEYVLEVGVYSLKNKQVDLLAQTSKSFPLIYFNMFSDNVNFTDIKDIENLEVSRENISISQNTLKKVYLSFIAKEIGSAYIDLKTKDVISSSQLLNDRISFNVYNQKEMKVTVNPDIFIAYGSKFEVVVKDSITDLSITDAFIKFYNDRGELITTVKGLGSTGQNGKYTIDNKFNFSEITMVVESYGYIPFEKKLYVVDDSLFLINPSEILINLGLDQMIMTEKFTINNNSEYVGQNIRFGDPVWLDGPDQIFLDFRGPILINKNVVQEYDVSVTVSNDLKFNTAYAYVPVFLNIGSREITKILKVRINKGLTLSDCIKVTPGNVNSFVGLNLNYTPPDVFKNSYRDYDYSKGINNTQNPLLSPYQEHTNYSDYLYSNGYNQQYTSSENSMIYTDPNYTYYATKPTTTIEGSENITYFIIENSCNHEITFNPQSVLTTTSSNKDLEISLSPVTVLPGEKKNYDIIIKNKSDRKQPVKYSYNIFWHNNYYSLEPSVLNVDVLDLTKSLLAYPTLITIPISQLHAQQSAQNAVRFGLTNIGTVPITDIQIGQYPKMVSSNLQIREYPREIDILEPGRTIPIDLGFSVNVAKSTYDDALINITGRVMGYSEPISAQVLLNFVISSPNCLKVSAKKLDFSLKVGEKKSRNVSITNYCAEPVSIIGIDKKQDAYFETFGKNPFRIFPANAVNVIVPNQTVTYTLELTSLTLGGSPSMPLIILGALQNSGNQVSSEEILVSVNLKDASFEEERDREVSKIVSLGYCEDLEEMDSFSMPLVSIGACTETSGYCDAISSTELILKKINELSSQVKQLSSQATGKTINTSCPINDAARGFCKISELGGDLSPLEFTFYMQNDVISNDLFKNVISKSNYPFKNYFIDVNPYDNASNYQGVYLGGNKIFLSNKFRGCARYTVEIDGFIAASQDVIYPERAYYYINVLKSEETLNCKKDILNYLNFLPWDLTLSKNNRQGTWLTLFSGDENLSKDLIKGIGKFGNDVDLRYIYPREVLSSQNNLLNVEIGDILENDKALAKISFNDLKIYPNKNPERINILLNNKYAMFNNQVPDKVSKDFVNIISSMITKNDVSLKACVSKDKDYMLILDVVKAGDLFFTNKDASIVLNEKESCTMLNIKSSIDEVLKITSTKIDGLEVGFKLNKDDSLKDSIDLSVLQNKDSNFLFCVRPLSSDNLSYFVNQKLTVKASSIFSKSGIGNRNVDLEVFLRSCAITPEEFLLTSYDLIYDEHIKKEEDRVFGQNVVALIDWQNSYNTSSKEELCESLQKLVLNSNYNKKLFFNYESVNCEIKDVDSKITSKINKGLTNAGTYFARCGAVCAGCYGLSAIVLPASIMGAVVDCLGFSCGLPSLQIFLNTITDGEGGIGWAIDQLVGFVLADDEFKLVGPLFSKIEHFVTGTLGSVLAGSLKAGSMAATTPLDTALTPLIPGGAGATFVPVTTAAGAAATGGAAATSTTVRGLESQLDNFMRYFTGAGGTTITFTAANTADDLLLQNYLTRINAAPGATNLQKLSVLSPAEIDELARIAETGAISGRYSGGVNKLSFATKLRQHSANLTTGGVGTAGTAGAGTAAIAGEALSDADVDVFKTTVDDQITKVDKSINELKKKIDVLEKNEARSKYNPQKVRVKPNKVTAVQRNSLKATSDISALKAELALQENAKTSLTKIKTGLGRAIPDPNNTGYKIIPQDAVDEFRNISNQNINLKSAKPKWQARLRGVGGFARGLGCGIVGNIAGVNGLKKNGVVNLNYSIEFTNTTTFEKNIFYVANVDYIEPLEGEYESRYVISIYPFNSKDADEIRSLKTTRVDKCILEAE